MPPATQVTPILPVEGQSRYAQLAASLRARITAGDWAPGAAIPAETALAREHGVALGTLRQAVALLVAQGLLERQHGRGTFVRSGIGGATMLRFFRFRTEGSPDATPTSRILKRKTAAADTQTAATLGLPVGAPVLELLRLRSLDGRPCLLETLWLPLPLYQPLLDLDTAQWGDLLYPLLQRSCGVTVHRAEDALRFGALSATQARHLHLASGAPCVRVERRAFDLAGHCIERRTTLGDAHAFQYTLNLH